ncbi:reverse transcriptase domain-containing protein [Tanacetum coccineum]
MEEVYKPCVQPQRRLNPNLKEVVKKEVIKLLDAGIIYPISDSPGFLNAYHSQTSGQVENTNHALKWILEKTVGSNIKNWSKKLDDALWAFRTAFKTPISFTSFRMVYGKSCHLPIEIEHKSFWALKLCNMDLSEVGVERNNQLNKLEELRFQAYKTSKTYKERTKKWHDNRLKEKKEFQTRDHVLRFNSRLKLFLRKLRSRWSGPFTLKQAYPYRTIELFNHDGTCFKVNGHRVKHYHEEPLNQNGKESLAPGRKAHLLEDKQIPSVGVFDEVFSIWKALRGNTRDLDSFGEEMDKSTNLYQNLLKIMLTERGDGVASIK